MRREAQHPLARGTDHAVLFEEAMPAEERWLYSRWNRSDDRRPDRTRRPHPPYDLLQPIREARRQRHDVLGDPLDPRLQQQLERCAQTVDAVRVQRPRLEAPRVGKEIARAVDELAAAIDVRPAVLDHVELPELLL